MKITTDYNLTVKSLQENFDFQPIQGGIWVREEDDKILGVVGWRAYYTPDRHRAFNIWITDMELFTGMSDKQGCVIVYFLNMYNVAERAIILVSATKWAHHPDFTQDNIGFLCLTPYVAYAPVTPYPLLQKHKVSIQAAIVWGPEMQQGGRQQYLLGELYNYIVASDARLQVVFEYRPITAALQQETHAYVRSRLGKIIN